MPSIFTFIAGYKNDMCLLKMVAEMAAPFAVILAVVIFNQLDRLSGGQKYHFRNLILLNKDR